MQPNDRYDFNAPEPFRSTFAARHEALRRALGEFREEFDDPRDRDIFWKVEWVVREVLEASPDAGESTTAIAWRAAKSAWKRPGLFLMLPHEWERSQARA